jgi:hypothetical protein
MANWALLLAYSGFQYDATKRTIRFAPAASGEFRCFFSTGTGWGTFVQHDHAVAPQLLYGSLQLSQLDLSLSAAAVAETMTVNGRPMSSQTEANEHGTTVAFDPLALAAVVTSSVSSLGRSAQSHDSRKTVERTGHSAWTHHWKDTRNRSHSQIESRTKCTDTNLTIEPDGTTHTFPFRGFPAVAEVSASQTSLLPLSSCVAGLVGSGSETYYSRDIASMGEKVVWHETLGILGCGGRDCFRDCGRCVGFGCDLH